MDLTNRSYVVRIRTRNATERYFRDGRGWVKVSARGRRFRMTAEQVLNHVLPAFAGVKRGLSIEVKHRPPPGTAAAAGRPARARRAGPAPAGVLRAPNPSPRGASRPAPR